MMSPTIAQNRAGRDPRRLSLQGLIRRHAPSVELDRYDPEQVFLVHSPRACAGTARVCGGTIGLYRSEPLTDRPRESFTQRASAFHWSIADASSAMAASISSSLEDLGATTSAIRSSAVAMRSCVVTSGDSCHTEFCESASNGHKPPLVPKSPGIRMNARQTRGAPDRMK